MSKISIPSETIESIVKSSHYLFNQMIVQANSRSNINKGDPKVGGHSSACASCVHILGALHLIVKTGHDFIANKPHASPCDHSYNYLLDLLLDKHHRPLSQVEAEKVMYQLRAFPSEENPYVFQSYHSHYDPDHHGFLPSGTVGIPPVMGAYLALAYQFCNHQNYKVPPAHFWSLIGDSEFREGSLFESIPDIAERELGSVTWIIDYNRQSLDGHRITHPDLKTDAHRIEKTFIANGWDVIQLRHGSQRLQLFSEKQGELFKQFLEEELDDFSLQILLQIQDINQVRDFILKIQPALSHFLKSIPDKNLMTAIHDLGGHDVQLITEALLQSKQNPKKPVAIIAHTIKGWGLSMAAKGGNHSTIPSEDELIELKDKTAFKKISSDFPRFDPSSEEGKFLAHRKKQLMKDIHDSQKLKEENEKTFESIADALPSSLGISYKLMSYPHTQWMLGQWVSKLSRIASLPASALKENEKAFYPLAQMLLCLSPDVGTSTNISFSMDNKIYTPIQLDHQEKDWNIEDKKAPDITPGTESNNRFIRFEIAEAASLSCTSSFGKIKSILGIPLLPLMSVYDFFIKRALDQYFYGLYWQSSFILAGTPSGITLSPEGAQHGWKSDIQIPNQICWEPFFCQELDWILTDALYRHLKENNKERTGVLVRAVTRGVDQNLFLSYLKKQKRFKENQEIELHTTDNPLPSSTDESELKNLGEEEILNTIRTDILNGAYKWIDYSGYKDYKPGENVVNIFAMGSLGVEAAQASNNLLKKGIYANVIIVTSPDLLLGSLAHQNNYSYLNSILKLDKQAGIVSVHDGEAGMLDNIGSVLGIKQESLAVRKHSLCGRPEDIYKFHELDADSISISVLKNMHFN